MSVKLHDYQLKYLENAPHSFIMAANVGLGKTIMALEHYRRHNQDGQLLVVAPASKVRTGDWQREIEKFFEGHTPAYEVLSYEMFSKRAKEFLDDELTVIFDEMHFICNATAKRSKASIGVARVARQWIGLSATPLPNGWRSAETYAVLTGLAKNKTDFVTRYVIIDRSRGFPLILGYRFTDQLEQWWARIARPLERTGDMHLPSENIASTQAMTPKLGRVYKKAVKDRILDDEPLDNSSKLFNALRQIPTPARVDMLHSIIDGTDEHIVIFYNYNSEREAIVELLDKSFKERTIYEQSGHKSELPSRDRWSELSPSVTLVQYQSGSQAIELTYASITVYFSPCTSYANYEQSKGRTRRNGQEKTTLFYHIAIDETLDKHIWGILRQKRDFSTDLMEKVLANQ